MAYKTPLINAQRRDESYHNGFWYPSRCEKTGCDVKDPATLLHCSGCRMVQYCCEEHQRQDWPAHKKDCKAFKSLGLRATFYTDEAMLAAFPLRSYKSFHNSSKPELPAGPCSCTICGKKDTEAKITRTECCHQVLCDTEYQYPVGSYSRDFCPRSHSRYTLCGHHGAEKECSKNKDWRECKNCMKPDDPSDIPDKLWRGLNAYNFCPLLSKDVPRHSMCETCSSCGVKFVGGVTGYSRGMQGTIHCPECTNAGKGGFSQITGTQVTGMLPPSAIPTHLQNMLAPGARPWT